MPRNSKALIGAHTKKNAKTIALSFKDPKGKNGYYKDRYIPKTPANLKKVNSIFKEHEFDGKNHIWFDGKDHVWH